MIEEMQKVKRIYPLDLRVRERESSSRRRGCDKLGEFWVGAGNDVHSGLTPLGLEDESAASTEVTAVNSRTLSNLVIFAVVVRIENVFFALGGNPAVGEL